MMIRSIIENLHLVEATSDNLKIAKGKYKLATNIKEGIKQIKEEWQSKKQ